MQFASSGSLEDYILTRTLPPPSPLDDIASPLDAFHLAELTPEQAKAAIRARRASKGAVSNGSGPSRPPRPSGGGGERRGVRLLGREEIEGVFGGVVRGLGYLHSHGILHLDLKCSNVLLHQEEGDFVPRALISDFGTSRTVVYGGGLDEKRRSGNTEGPDPFAWQGIV
jgi:serine/threonine protein kinase